MIHSVLNTMACHGYVSTIYEQNHQHSHIGAMIVTLVRMTVVALVEVAVVGMDVVVAVVVEVLLLLLLCLIMSPVLILLLLLPPLF